MKALFMNNHHLILMWGEKRTAHLPHHLFFIQTFKILIYFFLMGLGLCCCARTSSSCGEWGLLSGCGEWGLLASCSARSSHHGGLSCCRAQALVLQQLHLTDSRAQAYLGYTRAQSLHIIKLLKNLIGAVPSKVEMTRSIIHYF